MDVNSRSKNKCFHAEDTEKKTKTGEIQLFYKKNSLANKIFVKTAKKGIEISGVFVYNVSIADFTAGRGGRSLPKGE